MSSMSEDIQCAGSDTRPPMLDRTDFESWQQRIRLYCLGKDNGENIMKSINEGPFHMGTVSDVIAGGTEGAVQQGPVRARVLNDLSAEEKERYKADIRATNILLQGIPKDIYSLINHYTDAKDIWENVKMILEGSELTKDDRESQLYDEFEHFRQIKGETIQGYYVSPKRLKIQTAQGKDATKCKPSEELELYRMKNSHHMDEYHEEQTRCKMMYNTTTLLTLMLTISSDSNIIPYDQYVETQNRLYNVMHLLYEMITNVYSVKMHEQGVQRLPQPELGRPKFKHLQTRLFFKCVRTGMLVSGTQLLKNKDRESFKAHEFLWKSYIGQSDSGNDHLGAIMGYGDYVMGEQCDLKSILRGGTWTQSILYILKGSRGTNLYMISIDEMMKSSPICLLSKASKSKSWLWHRRLNHLNFGTINDLARKDLVRGLPRLKFEKDHLCSACQLGKSKNLSETPNKKQVVEADVSYTVEAAQTMMIFSKAHIFYGQKVQRAGDVLFNSMFDERHLNNLELRTYLMLLKLMLKVFDPPRYSLSTTIAQDAPSTSDSSSTSDIHLPVQHHKIAEEPIQEDTPIIHDVLHPSHNLVTVRIPGSAQSSSGNVNAAEPNQVNYPLDHIRRWTKDHPLDNIVGNPSRPVSTRKQLASDALWCLLAQSMFNVYSLSSGSQSEAFEEYGDVLKHKLGLLQRISSGGSYNDLKNRLLQIVRIKAIRIFIANAATKNMIILTRLDVQKLLF
ncbi:retrovirus-related pol polyprotein from transposon TNT 1-94 [Tanacetum coccineum]